MFDKLKILGEIADIYKDGGNIIQYLKGKKSNEERGNSLEEILISYDFQAGTYIKLYQEKTSEFFQITNCIAKEFNDTIKKLNVSYESIFEAGVGEATTLFEVGQYINDVRIYGCDIAWSRIKAAQNFMKENGMHNANLFVGDMFNLPIKDNSIDIVYTRQALEPNGGKEKELLIELYRVARKYLILMEPAYELADDSAKRRMEQHGYIRGLLNAAKNLHYNVVDYKLMQPGCWRESNPIAMMIIKKETNEELVENPLCCPVTNANLIKYKNAMFAEDAFLVYPILDNVPCLLKSNAMIATKFKE